LLLAIMVSFKSNRCNLLLAPNRLSIRFLVHLLPLKASLPGSLALPRRGQRRIINRNNPQVAHLKHLCHLKGLRRNLQGLLMVDLD
jgi:hypothetical protein